MKTIYVIYEINEEGDFLIVGGFTSEDLALKAKRNLKINYPSSSYFIKMTDLNDSGVL